MHRHKIYHLGLFYILLPELMLFRAGLPVDPSYVPERFLGLTDRMTFFQRVQNCLLYVYWDIMRSGVYPEFDELKVKHNIEPEISTFDSAKRARLYFFLGSFGLEFPRPLPPNTIYVLHSVGLEADQKVSSPENSLFFFSFLFDKT